MQTEQSRLATDTAEAFIRGYDFVPKDSAFYADRRLHPNNAGFEAYATHLIDAIGR